MGQQHPLRMPRLLLVEDDAISQTYFRAVLESLPAQVDVVASQAGALAAIERADYDLWLIDLSLPDGQGQELLARLRRQRPQVPALAHTADADPALRQPLLAAGFRDLLVKPIQAVALTSAVRSALTSDRPDWDNAAAASAMNHNMANVQALRGLFLDELPGARADVLSSARAGDNERLRARLHRLQASCGLVGASRLAEAVESLRRSPDSAIALDRFDSAARALLG
ncbi:response regulator [Xanthomonas sp. XNM01]|nr:response regulator [Xanthomonas sp. XNM01]